MFQDLRRIPVADFDPVGIDRLDELLGQHGVVLLGEVAQRVLQGQHFLFGREDVLTPRSVVDLGIVGFHFRQFRRNARQDFFLESHTH